MAIFGRTPIKLLDSVNTDTLGIAVPICVNATWNLGVFATSFGGGAVTLQMSVDGGNMWAPVTMNGTVFQATSNAVELIPMIKGGQYIRATFAGSSGASNVSVYLI